MWVKTHIRQGQHQTGFHSRHISAIFPRLSPMIAKNNKVSQQNNKWLISIASTIQSKLTCSKSRMEILE